MSQTEDAPINWLPAFILIATPIAAITLIPWYALNHDFSTAAWVLMIGYLYANGLGITAGYHRLWAHRAYEAHWTVEVALMLFGGAAIQNSVLNWASGHRTHHRFVDDVDKDPYSAKRGFWFSHVWVGCCVTIHPAHLITPTHQTCKKTKSSCFNTITI